MVEGNKNGKLVVGSVIALKHKESKWITNVLEGVGSLPYDEEVSNEVGKMSQTNMCWHGIDVTYAIFMQQMTWRHQEKFYRVGGGIMVDGINIMNLVLKWWRNQIGLVI